MQTRFLSHSAFRNDLPLIVGDDFAHAHGGTLKSLGLHQLRGLDLPHELFTPRACLVES